MYLDFKIIAFIAAHIQLKASNTVKIVEVNFISVNQSTKYFPDVL